MASIVITGGCGFLGVQVAERLLSRDPTLRILLTDIAEHPRVARLGDRVDVRIADLGDPAAAAALIQRDTRLVFHFASLVSGGAERDFDAGMRANLHATMHLLEACRRNAERPRLVFTSSIATFGGSDLPDTVDDRTVQHPQNSYGVAKLVGEALINDYARKGFVCGRAIRLPAVVVRDEPNTAASGYASALIREPLAGRDCICPVTPETRLPIISTGRCVDVLVGLGDAEGAALGDWRALNAPGISPSAGEIAAAVQASGLARGRITFAPDPAVMAIVAAWPKRWVASRAERLGLRGDDGIESIIAAHAAARQGG